MFIDIDAISPGVDFRKILRNSIAECNVFLAVIGDTWLTCARLNDPTDWVRIEIEAALERDSILVVPIRVREATMPKVLL